MSSIHARTSKSGTTTWRVAFRQGDRQSSRSFVSQEKARAWQIVLDAAGPAKALQLLEDETPPDTAPTLVEHIAWHVDHLTGITDGTRRTYRRMTDRHLGDLGSMPVHLVTRADIADWVNQLQGKGLSGKTIRNIHGLVSGAYRTGVRDGLVLDNPCAGTRLPRTDHTTTEMCFLTWAEYARLEAEMTPIYQPLIRFLVGTGARYGEATALQVQDVDLDRQTARIRRAWKMTGRARRELGPPKTKRSNRTVRFGDSLARVLEPLLDGRGPREWLFTQRNGRIIHQASFHTHHWTPAVRRLAGDQIGKRRNPSGRVVEYSITRGPGKRPRIHDLRHTYASWAVQAGIPLPVLQRQLGHESITTTVDRYSHLAASDFDALATLTDRALGGKGTALPPGPGIPS